MTTKNLSFMRVTIWGSVSSLLVQGESKYGEMRWDSQFYLRFSIDKVYVYYLNVTYIPSESIKRASNRIV